MNSQKQFKIYRIYYNLCAFQSSEILGCKDCRLYMRTQDSFCETSVRKKFEKSGFEFTLYSIEELDKEQIQKLSFDAESIPLFR